MYVDVLKHSFQNMDIMDYVELTYLGNPQYFVEVNRLVGFSQCGKMRNSLSPKNISSNQLFSNLFSKSVTFTEILPKIRERFPLISTLCKLISREKNCVAVNKRFSTLWYGESKNLLSLKKEYFVKSNLQ